MLSTCDGDDDDDDGLNGNADRSREADPSRQHGPSFEELPQGLPGIRVLRRPDEAGQVQGDHG